MRKVFWCCLAAGAAVCCAFWTAAYISQHPDSSLSRVASAAAHSTCEPVPQVTHLGKSVTVETDGLIPADPIPVNETPPAPEPSTLLPPEIASLLTPPPIVIHEEAFNVIPAPSAKVESKTVSSTIDMSESLKPRGPLVMPYCKDNCGPAPIMPHCGDDNAAPVMPSAAIEDMEKVSRAGRAGFDLFAFWVGYFSGPGRIGCEPTYTVEKPALPGGDESSEPPAPKSNKGVDPSDLFSHPRRLQMPRPAETESDTMEMRPSDWKPYSLDPGPF